MCSGALHSAEGERQLMQRLKDRVCLITGGAGSIGMATACRFHEEGAIVLLMDRNADVLREGNPTNWYSFVADVTREEEVRDVLCTIAERFGKLDVLINNAASWTNDGAVTEIAEADWDSIQAATLKSVYLCCKYSIPIMRKQGEGSIVNVASVNALFGLALAAYSAAKGGILSLTRVMATMHGPEGIRVNAISPGTIRTSSWEPLLAQNPNALEEWKGRYPLRRVGTPEEVAALAVYLASLESANTTGANFVMDGGISAGMVVPGYGPTSLYHEETHV